MTQTTKETASQDIVEWLRGKPMVVNENGYTGISVAGGTLLNKAADEIERMREALKKVLSVQPIKGDEGSTDIISLAKALLEIDSIARAALKEKE